MQIEVGAFDIPNVTFNRDGSKRKAVGLIERFICFDLLGNEAMMKVDCETEREFGTVYKTLRQRIKGYGKSRCKYNYDIIGRGFTVYVIRRDLNADKEN